MARVTVEDCVERIPNRFELVMLAAKRSREISSGSSLTVERNNDKNPVVALREIADETVPLDDLREELVRLQKHIEVDEPEEDDEIEMMTAASLANEVGMEAAAAGVGAGTSDKSCPITVRMTSRGLSCPRGSLRVNREGRVIMLNETGGMIRQYQPQ